MESFVAAVAIFMIAFFAMTVGWFFANKAIKGTCGGLGALMGACDLCDSRDKCQKKSV